MPQAGQALIQREILLQQAGKLGLNVTSDDIRHELREGPWSVYFFPKGQFIGQERYADWVDQQLHMSTAAFEKQIGTELEINRLESLITGGVSVSDKTRPRAIPRQHQGQVRLRRALRRRPPQEINPTDADLQDFFKQNARATRTPSPKRARSSYVAFTADQLPGGTPQVSDAEVQSYYNAHKDQFRSRNR